ncbi:AraC family transcriptional regulator [Shewanella sp. JM162201]|uniref:AraC family transcriptional regulator n=1 Tax=Shewanella jiangmenensis TaxID=2837387 RepID=A0ABS5V5M7_9GAMM|nr:AraC family transcriptional regulator [Shewanella jiangmenensis]MBT1445761.1 AraC family transcriptional regulator [Shewanella jiangmenensis]
MQSALYRAEARIGDQGYPAWELCQILRAIRQLFGDATHSDICERLGVAYELLPSMTLVPVWQVQGAMEALCSLSDNPAIGFIAASDYRVSELGFLKSLLANCATLKDCFLLLNDNPEWAGTMNDSLISWSADRLTVRWLNTARLPAAQFICHFQHSLGAIVVLGRELCGVDFPLLHVALQGEAHPGDELSVLCGCEVSFNADFCEWSVALDTLSLPLTFEFSDAEKAPDALTTPSFIDTVLGALKAHMPELPTLAELGGELGMSDRTLRRRLADNGCSYQRLVDKLRSQAAISLILEGELGVDDIAERLGFTDVSHFRASFKHWLGAPPGRFARLVAKEPTKSAAPKAQ